MRRHSSRSASLRVRLSCTAFLLSCLLTSVEAAQESPQWVTINLDSYSQRYVDLERITPKNVGQLQELCSFKLKAVNWFSSGLLMVGGRIYVNTLGSTFAIDATSCEGGCFLDQLFARSGHRRAVRARIESVSGLRAADPGADQSLHQTP